MNIKQFFQRLIRSSKQKPSFQQSGMQGDKSAMMEKMLTMLSNTQDVELTCDQVFAMLDEFAELAARGEDVTELMPLVQQHLDMCADCRDEYKVLQSIVQGTT